MDTSRDTGDLGDLDRATLVGLIEAALLEDPDNEFLWDELARLTYTEMAA